MHSLLTQWWRDARAWLRLRGWEIWLITGIWAAVSVLIYLLAVGHESPRRFQDEFLFWGVAKSFANGAGVTWRGADLGLKSWLYPVLISPIFWFFKSIPAQYTAVHLANSLMISATIFPAFLMARLLLGRWQALLAALLAVSVPAMNYAGVIGTESLGYPVFTAACGAILLALARPRPRNTLLALVMVVVALLTRTQFVLVLPIFIGTLLLATVMAGPGRRREYLRQRRSVWVTLLVISGLAGMVVLAQGQSSVGLYAGAFHGLPLTSDAFSFWAKSFTADVYLLAGIIPVIATLALFGRSENRRDPLVGALIALAFVASVALILQISWFSATNPYEWRSRHIFYERYMFYVGPLFFTGLLVAWRRVGWPSALLSSALAVVVISGFQSDAVMVPFSYDSFGLSLIGRHLEANPGELARVGTMLARVAAVLGLILIAQTVRRRGIARTAQVLAVGVTLVWLLGAQVQSWHYARTFSHSAFEQVARPVNFVDRNTDEPVGMIVTATDSPLMYFTTEFWNNQIVRAFGTEASPFRTPIMYSPQCIFGWQDDGTITGTGCDEIPDVWYLRSPSVTMHLKDERQRVHPVNNPGITLMAGQPPARILALTDGRTVGNGLINMSMTIRTFLDQPGELRIRLGGKATMVVSAGRHELRVPGGSQRTLTVPLPAFEKVTTINARSTGGLPATATVSGLEVRERGGAWRSIL